MNLLRRLTFLLRSVTVILTVLLFWIYLFLLDASICSTMAFHALGNSDHVVVSVSFDFSSTSKGDALFHCIAYDYSSADWDGLGDHWRDVSWEDIFAASETPHSSLWFLTPCAAAIVHRKHFSHLYQQNKSSESKVKFSQASDHCKKVLETTKVAFANKTKESITSQKLDLQDLLIANSVLNKGNSAIPLYSATQRCYFRHLIKQNCLLKIF